MRWFAGALLGLWVAAGCGSESECDHDSDCNSDQFCWRRTVERKISCGMDDNRCHGASTGTEEETVGSCVAWLDEGERCGGYGETNPCREGLRCKLGQGAEARCAAPGDVGEPCAEDSECSGGLICRHQPSGVCLVRSDEGEPCEHSADCRSGLLCNEAVLPVPLCQRPRAGKADEPCSERALCGLGLTCNKALLPPRCREPGAQGERCQEDADCLLGLRCDRACGLP